ncbi:hypothetical protein GN958_ATG11223 [Phytophthora infestans]|uniref:Uncharacterized protein n=1 Tax=Phytophthora infestans TaxID=4787 RepID=A0A8S9UMZ1_PHYIN|nr:hypothetical protein GN958_ATG11223 [Phytophthora infestans]
MGLMSKERFEEAMCTDDQWLLPPSYSFFLLLILAAAESHCSSLSKRYSTRQRNRAIPWKVGAAVENRRAVYSLPVHFAFYQQHTTATFPKSLRPRKTSSSSATSLKFEVMKLTIVTTFASILIVGISAEGFACAAVPYIICDGGNNPLVCASNGVTYWKDATSTRPTATTRG